MTGSVLLPVPPSANKLYKRVLNVRGRRPRTAEYEAWRRQAGLVVNTLSVRAKHRQPVAVLIEANVGYNRDIANIEKATSDLLTDCGVLHDDRWIDDMHIRRVDTVDRGWMRVGVSLP